MSNNQPPSAGDSLQSIQMRQMLRRLRDKCDIVDRHYRVHSKLPLLGPLIAWVRRNLTSHLREPYLDPALERQAAFNWQLVDVLQQLSSRRNKSNGALPALDLTGAPLDELATEADIYYAYQIILGRAPDEHGWNHYCRRLGELRVNGLAVELMLSSEFKERDVYYSIVGAYRGEEPVLVELEAFSQYVMPSDNSIGACIRQTKTWEPYMTEQVRSVLRPGMTFVDLGANIGYFSLLAANLVGPTGRVIAVEPNEQNCKLIWASAFQNGFTHLDVYPFAAGDCSMTFTFGRRDGSNGMLMEEVAFGSGMDARALLSRTLVRTVVLDELLHGLERLDVIKIDVEGAEYRVLRGMERLIKRHRPLIFSEFAPDMLHPISGVTGEAYLSWLFQCGYRVAVIERERNELIDCGSDGGAVMALQAAEPSHLLDIVARPE